MAATAVSTDNSATNLQRGSLTLVLQAHIPYVLSHRHYPHGPNWLYETVAETYIPLINLCNRLAEDHDGPWFTLALSPILCEQLAHLDFAGEFEAYLQHKIDVSQRNEREFAEQGLESFRDMAFFWENWYTGVARDFNERYGRTLLDDFRSLQELGHIEIITTTATHADLTAMANEESARVQIQAAVDNYKKHFARQPRGICLIEGTMSNAAYRAPLTQILQEYGFDYYVDSVPLQTHSIQPNYTDDSTVDSPPTGSALLHRYINDTVEGYPSEGVFLDFHKRHFPGDLKLWRITDENANPVRKEPYEPFRSGSRCEALANHFVETLKSEIQENEAAGASPHMTVALNASLLGHRWFEGLNWLSRVLKKVLQDNEVTLTFGSETPNLVPFATDEAVTPLPTELDGIEASGSWENSGDDSSLLNNRATNWMRQEIRECEQTMVRLATMHSETRNPKLQQVLTQCARELLLMQSCDWPLLVATTSARDYAELRCASHINVFQILTAIVEEIAAGEFMSEGERCFLEATTERDSCFVDLTYALWSQPMQTAEGV